MSKHHTLFTAGLLALSGWALADTEVSTGTPSLEDLMQVEVTSVSKKPQRLANVAASIFVITAEDIRLSGANSIPEVLRLAPGVDATRVSGNRWAVSVRGFADRAANKLQVLVDGRSVFNPEFSGVVWEHLLIPLEDIERIEVIRGPGASVWGSNAVNGVISIITRSAAATQGAQVVAGGGTIEGGYIRTRWGGSNAERDRYYRVYASTQNASFALAPYGAGHDEWSNAALGFRVDGYASGGTRWDVSGDFVQGKGDVRTARVSPAATDPGRTPGDFQNASLRARTEQKMDDGSNIQVQAALASLDYKLFGGGSKRSTIDLGMQHRLAMGSRHELIWGGDYRYSSDTMLNNDYMVMNDPSRQLSYYGLFAQDEITVADTLRLTLGLRMDHSPFTDWESQPTARLAWNLQPTQTLWAAASKAVRAPSRNEIGLNLNFYGEPQTVPPFGSVPVITHLKSDNTFQSEKLVAYEVGLRSQWLSTLSSDVTVFSHQYSNLRIPGTPVLSYAGFPAYIDATIPIINGGELTLNGLELSSDWRPTQDWRFQLSYTYNDVGHVDAAQASASSLVLPENITSLRASWTPTSNTNADLWWRYMGARSSPGFPPAARSGYTSVDLRLGWKPRRNLELALIGQNLTNGECAALDGVALAFENNGSIISCMPRVVGVQARTDF